MILIQEDEKTGELHYQVEGQSVPVADPEMAETLRSLARFQKTMAEAKDPAAAIDAMVRSGARLFLRLAATMGARVQGLSGELEGLEEDVERVADVAAAGGDDEAEAVKLTMDEARLVVGPALEAAQLIGTIVQNIRQAAPSPTPEQTAHIATLAHNEQTLGTFSSMLRFKIAAIETAAAEEARLEAEEEAAEGDEDEEDDEGEAEDGEDDGGGA